MEIYLPIVQVHIDVIFILFVSFAVGVLSGLFGVGGGFLMTPFLIFLGILSHYIISDPTKGFTLLVLIYIITIPISPIFYYRLRSKFEKNNKNN